MSQPTPITSPCIRVCCVDPKSGFCEGCYRTLKEIATWGRMAPEEREHVLSVLEERRAAVTA